MSSADDSRAAFRREVDKLRKQVTDVLSMTETNFSQLGRLSDRMVLEAKNARLAFDRQTDAAFDAFDKLLHEVNDGK
jgi:DNA-binding FadR family transcriptional regulator